MYVARGGVGGEGVSGWENWVWALPILWGHGECWTCVCVLVAGCGWCRWGWVVGL